MRKFAYGESGMEMIRSRISASVIWEEQVIFISLRRKRRPTAYRLWGILIDQAILKEDLAVFADYPGGSESQRLLRYI
jgi:hypothetical protein